jgi:hypothetical protein
VAEDIIIFLFPGIPYCLDGELHYLGGVYGRKKIGKED